MTHSVPVKSLRNTEFHLEEKDQEMSQFHLEEKEVSRDQPVTRQVDNWVRPSN